MSFKYLSTNPTKLSIILEHWQQSTNCLSVLNRFVRLALTGLTKQIIDFGF